MASSTGGDGKIGERLEEREVERERDRTGEILPLSRGMMPQAVGVCMGVRVDAHAHPYWSYFMAKLFRRKNNSISARYKLQYLASALSCYSSVVRFCELGMSIEVRISFHFRLSAPIITLKIKDRALLGKLISPSLLCRVLVYKTST